MIFDTISAVGSYYKGKQEVPCFKQPKVHIVILTIGVYHIHFNV